MDFWQPELASVELEEAMEAQDVPESDRDELRRFAEFLSRRKAQREGVALPPAPKGMREYLLGEEAPKMTLNDYQQAALRTAVYPNIGSNLVYAVLGLVGECGEIANKLKKVGRDDGGVLTEERRAQLADEISDVCWYIAAVAMELGMDLETVAKRGLAKLAARAEAGTLHGQGDQR